KAILSPGGTPRLPPNGQTSLRRRPDRRRGAPPFALGRGNMRPARGRANRRLGVDDVALSEEDRRLLRGAEGDGPRLAMRVLVAAARAAGAERLRDVTGAHIDGCLYHGRAGLDFVERLAGAGARVT